MRISIYRNVKFSTSIFINFTISFNNTFLFKKKITRIRTLHRQPSKISNLLTSRVLSKSRKYLSINFLSFFCWLLYECSVLIRVGPSISIFSFLRFSFICSPTISASRHSSCPLLRRGGYTQQITRDWFHKNHILPQNRRRMVQIEKWATCVQLKRSYVNCTRGFVIKWTERWLLYSEICYTLILLARDIIFLCLELSQFCNVLPIKLYEKINMQWKECFLWFNKSYIVMILMNYIIMINYWYGVRNNICRYFSCYTIKLIQY